MNHGRRLARATGTIDYAMQEGRHYQLTETAFKI